MIIPSETDGRGHHALLRVAAPAVRHLQVSLRVTKKERIVQCGGPTETRSNMETAFSCWRP